MTLAEAYDLFVDQLIRKSMNTSPLDEWNSIDHFSETFEEYNCAFLDILGYKQKAVDYFEQKFNLFGRIERALRTASLAQQITGPLLDTTGLKIEIVSDSIIMTQPATSVGLGPFFPFTCQLASVLSFEGLFIRGGIARGRHIRKRTAQGFDFLASEALQKAYALESQRAVTPRVLIDAELIDSLFEEEKKLIVKEGSEYFVHFAHHVINRDANNVSDVLGEMRELHAMTQASQDSRVADKIRWLIDYYCWTIQQNTRWNFNTFREFSSGVDREFEMLP